MARKKKGASKLRMDIPVTIVPTRVPLSIKTGGELVETTTGLKSSKLKGYPTAESVSEYGGISQRWILVESQERRNSDITRFCLCC